MFSFRRLFVSRTVTRLPAWAPPRAGFRWKSTTPTARGSQDLPVVPDLDAENFAFYKERVDDIILRTPTVEQKEALEKARGELTPSLYDFAVRVEKFKESALLRQWQNSLEVTDSLNEALLEFFSYMNLKVKTHLSVEALEDPSLRQWGCAFVGTRFMPRPLLPSTLPNGIDIGCPFFSYNQKLPLDSITDNIQGADKNVFEAVLKDSKARTTYENLLFFGGDSGSGKTHAALFLASYLRKYNADLRSHPPVVVYAAAQALLSRELYHLMESCDAIALADESSEEQKWSACADRNKHALELLERVIYVSIGKHLDKWFEYFALDRLPSCFLVVDELIASPALMHALTSWQSVSGTGTPVLVALNNHFEKLFYNVQVVGASTVTAASVVIACSLPCVMRTYQLLPSSVLFEKQMTELKPLYNTLSDNTPYMYVMQNCRCATEAFKIIREKEKSFYRVLSDALGALQPWEEVHGRLRKWCGKGNTSPAANEISDVQSQLAALCDNLEGALGKINVDGTRRTDNVGEEEQSTCTAVPKGTPQLEEGSKNSCTANPQKTLAMLKELSSNFRQGLALLEPEATTSSTNSRNIMRKKKKKKTREGKTTTTHNKRGNSKKTDTTINNIYNNSNTKRSCDMSAASIFNNNSLFDKDALKIWLDSQCSLGQSVDRVTEAVFSHAADIASDVIKLYRDSDDLTQYDAMAIHRIVEHGAVLCLTGKQTWKDANDSSTNTGAKTTSNDTTSEHNKASANSALPDPVGAGLVSVASTTEHNMNHNYVTVTTTYRMGIHQLILGMTATAGGNAASEGNRIATPPTMRELCSFHPRGLQQFWLHLFAFLSEALQRHAAGDVPTGVFTTVVGQFLYSKKTVPLTKAQQEVLALMDAGMKDATTLLKAPVAFPGNWTTLQHVDDWTNEDHRSQITESFCHGVDRDPAKRKGFSLILSGDSATFADVAVIGRGAFVRVSVKRRVDYGGNRKELLRDVATLGFRVPELEEEHQKGAYEPQIAATAQLKAHLQCPVAVPVFVLFHEPHPDILRNMPEVEVRATEESGTQALRMKPIVLYIRPYLEYTEKTYKSAKLHLF